jgi:hypothetical protein
LVVVLCCSNKRDGEGFVGQEGEHQKNVQTPDDGFSTNAKKKAGREMDQKSDLLFFCMFVFL